MHMLRNVGTWLVEALSLTVPGPISMPLLCYKATQHPLLQRLTVVNPLISGQHRVKLSHIRRQSRIPPDVGQDEQLDDVTDRLALAP